MNILTFVSICGWVGAVLIVFAYIRISGIKIPKMPLVVWSGNSLKYQLANLIGAILVGADVGYKEVWGPFSLQVVWGLIGIFAIYKILKKTIKLD